MRSCLLLVSVLLLVGGMAAHAGLWEGSAQQSSSPTFSLLRPDLPQQKIMSMRLTGKASAPAAVSCFSLLATARIILWDEVDRNPADSDANLGAAAHIEGLVNRR